MIELIFVFLIIITQIHTTVKEQSVSNAFDFRFESAITFAIFFETFASIWRENNKQKFSKHFK